MTARPSRVQRRTSCRPARIGRSTALAAVVVAAVLGVAPAAQAVLPAYIAAPARVAPDLATKAKLPTLASLNACTVVPAGTRTWAVGFYSRGGAQLAYAEHTTGAGVRTSVPVKSAASVYLQGVAAGSARSIWAVGDRTASKGEEPLIEHSTGGGFTPVAAKLGMGSLQAISASSASDAWAVGTHPSGAPLIVHWNGTRWRQVTLGRLPAGAGTSIQLIGVATSGPGNVWLAGETSAGPVLARWTGGSFALTLLKPPSVAAGMMPTAVTTTSPHDVWLAGYVAGSAKSGRSTVVTSHNDGTGWSPVSVPSSAVRSVPSSIAAVGSAVYLGGYRGPKSLATSAPFMLEFTGGRWKADATARPGRNGVLLSVCASSKGAAAVGAWYAGDAAGSHRTPPHPLVVVRHGTAWRQPAT